MEEYIDRENFCEKVCRCNKERCDKSSCPLWNAPAADVVEVVRCRDCKHYVEEGGIVYGGEHSEAMLVPQENGFCSYGERKEG